MEYRKPAYRYGFDRGEEVVGPAVWRLPTHGRGKGIAPLMVVPRNLPRGWNAAAARKDDTPFLGHESKSSLVALPAARKRRKMEQEGRTARASPRSLFDTFLLFSARLWLPHLVVGDPSLNVCLPNWFICLPFRLSNELTNWRMKEEYIIIIIIRYGNWSLKVMVLCCVVVRLWI